MLFRIWYHVCFVDYYLNRIALKLGASLALHPSPPPAPINCFSYLSRWSHRCCHLFFISSVICSQTILYYFRDDLRGGVCVCVCDTDFVDHTHSSCVLMSDRNNYYAHRRWWWSSPARSITEWLCMSDKWLCECVCVCVWSYNWKIDRRSRELRETMRVFVTIFLVIMR